MAQCCLGVSSNAVGALATAINCFVFGDNKRAEELLGLMRQKPPMQQG
jgi:hypothetical protein